MKIVNALPLASVVLASFVAFGCSSKSATSPSTGSQEGDDSAEANASSAQASRIDQMILGPVSSADPTVAANNVAAATEWWPAGCATRKKDATNPAVVHVTLNDCSGPFGLLHWKGDITITFSKSASGALHAEAASSDMTVNDKPVTYSRSADITIAGDLRNVVGNGAWTRVNAKGETVSHTHSFTLAIDVKTGCRTANGSGTARVGVREIDATVTDYKVCRTATGDSCPTGTVVYTHKASGKTLTVKFDGSDRATLVGDKGGSIEVPLICG